MSSKETVAIIGASTKMIEALAIKLAGKNYRLLLVSAAEHHQFSALSSEIANQAPLAEIECIACIKDGCWEADSIVLVDTALDQELIKKVREVATQKIVVCITHQNSASLHAHRMRLLQELLPNSRVAGLLYETTSAKAMVSGADQEALAFISNLVDSADVDAGNGKRKQ